MNRKIVVLIAAALCGLFKTTNPAFAQGTAFTYQGQLQSSGGPVSGPCNLTFSLYTNPADGVAVAGPVTNNAVVVSNGLFTVVIDFGSSVWNGQTNWLAIAVETNGGGTFSGLTPRQQLTPSPYAIFASTAGNLSGTLSTMQLSGTVGNSQLANNSLTVNAGTGLSGGGVVGLGGSTTLDNAGVLSVAGNADITASSVGGAVTLGDTATSANTASTIVKRDDSGNFSGGTVTLAGSLNLPATAVSSDLIYSGANLLMDADANNNFFVGPGAGNLTLSGFHDTGVGVGVLQADTSGNNNTANGAYALYDNTSGSFNTADGAYASHSTSGSDNTADGFEALYSNTSGSNNIALGYQAGYNISTGSSNIDIGNEGVAGDTNIIRIGTGQAATYLVGNVFTPSGSVEMASDRNAKEDFAPINPRQVLDKVASLPVTEWNYKTAKDIEHIGPMAQDFQAAFGLNGRDDKHISVVDEGGVALAAIQGLNQRLEETRADSETKDEEIQKLKQQNDLLAERLAKLEQKVQSLAKNQ